MVEPALALTVHKSQGSEADHVILLWPEISAVSATSADGRESASGFERKLLYTAITRSRQRVDLVTATPFSRSDG